GAAGGRGGARGEWAGGAAAGPPHSRAAGRPPRGAGGARPPPPPGGGAGGGRGPPPRHYQAIIDWMLRPATDYTFMGTSPQAWARDNKQLAGDVQTAYIGGGFTADGAGATIQIAWPGARWDAAAAAALLPGARVRPVTLAGQQAWLGGPDSHHVFTAVWSYGPALVNVTGNIDQHQV